MNRIERQQKVKQRAAKGLHALRVRLIQDAAMEPRFHLSATSPPWRPMARDILDAVEGAKRGDPEAIETALIFLEADPWCFHSGYVKQDLFRHLRQVTLTEPQKARLRDVVVAAITVGPRAEFGQAIKTARALDTPELRARVLKIRDDLTEDEGSRKRAGWMTDAFARTANTSRRA